MERIKSIGLASTLLLSIVYLAYFPKQSYFGPILICFLIAFLSYFLILRSNWDLQRILIFAIVIRVLLVPAFPNLSDDIYRFIWDGQLLQNAMNPYLYLPTDLMATHAELLHQSEILFKSLNSPEYYTIYPPISQLIFAISTIGGGGELIPSTIIMKFILLLAEIGLLFLMVKLLRHYRIEENKIAIYACNPLVIVEVMGNMHFEGLMLTFLCLGWLFLLKQKLWVSALAFASSIGIKLLPLMLMPFLIVYLGWKRAITLFAIVGSSLILIFIPVWMNFSFFWKSLDLYFQKFEFNASVYYVLRWIGYQYKGFNLIHIIGPLLAFSTIAIITKLTLNYNNKSKGLLPEYWLFAFTSYLCLATTVHPWYVIVPIGLCMFTNFRFPILWSLLIILTYSNYSQPEYKEHLWFVAFEYMLVYAFLFYEIIQHRAGKLKVSKQ